MAHVWLSSLLDAYVRQVPVKPTNVRFASFHRMERTSIVSSPRREKDRLKVVARVRRKVERKGGVDWPSQSKKMF